MATSFTHTIRTHKLHVFVRLIVTRGDNILALMSSLFVDSLKDFDNAPLGKMLDCDKAFDSVHYPFSSKLFHAVGVTIMPFNSTHSKTLYCLLNHSESFLIILNVMTRGNNISRLFFCGETSFALFCNDNKTISKS